MLLRGVRGGCGCGCGGSVSLLEVRWRWKTFWKENWRLAVWGGGVGAEVREDEAWAGTR